MIRGKTAVLALRVLCATAMAVGFGATCYGFLNSSTIPLFAFDVPSWIVGVSCIYMGMRYWRRIPELENKIDPYAKFSFKNFSLAKSKARPAR